MTDQRILECAKAMLALDYPTVPREHLHDNRELWEKSLSRARACILKWLEQDATYRMRESRYGDDDAYAAMCAIAREEISEP